MSRKKSFYRDMTREKAQRIRQLYFRERQTQLHIAKRFGVAQSTVSRIVSGQVW